MYCDRAFACPMVLQIGPVEPEEASQTLRCSTCQRECASADALRQHIIAKHTTQPEVAVVSARNVPSEVPLPADSVQIHRCKLCGQVGASCVLLAARDHTRLFVTYDARLSGAYARIQEFVGSAQWSAHRGHVQPVDSDVSICSRSCERQL